MVYYKTMDKWIMCVVALILGMLLANMLKNVCGCKVVEGQWLDKLVTPDELKEARNNIDILKYAPVAPTVPIDSVEFTYDVLKKIGS